MTALLLALALAQQPDQCLAFVSFNLARGNDNFYTYFRISDRKLTIRQGDLLAYTVFLDAKNPVAKGGLDIEFADGGKALRDLDLLDDGGRRVHGNGDLSIASGRWLTRRVELDRAKGREAASWNLNFEGDAFGRYVQFVDDVHVVHSDGSKTTIYESGPPPARVHLFSNGFTFKAGIVAVERAKVGEKDIEPIIAEAAKLAEQQAVLAGARADLELAKKFLAQNPNPELSRYVEEAERALVEVENERATPYQIQAALHTVHEALQHTHPVMEKYTGHLVGHAHIDLQWLWEWQEGIVFTRDTFAQAAKFMDEFPGFTFSQSSSCLYQAIEEHYPSLFEAIKAKVKKGQWEIVGGRVCEADTNMISHESHARHFLYGQRYFRERFGKTATVGWEPDTFGHAAQMPQILKLGGCDSYYFCRGGKGKPLFWWEALDGSKVLAFEEPATGSWYNSDLSYKQFQEVLDFQKATGSKDMMWVYGVGNHGGGPTREYIEEALRWMKDKSKPKVRFSTASEFFAKLRTYDLTVIPTIAQELNPVFEGCYTSHTEIKKANRDAEAWTTTAEAVAAAASFFGFKYPRASFRRNWEEIAFNHHHDTLPGTAIHASYDRTLMQLNRVVADDKDIVKRAMESIVINVTPKPGGSNVLVFNPLGWTRSGWVTLTMVKSGWDGGVPLSPTNGTAYGPDGKGVPVSLVNPASKHGRFWAKDLPPFGYKVFQIKTSPVSEPNVMLQTRWKPIADARLDNGRIGARFGGDGVISSAEGHRLRVGGPLGLGRLEVHYEDPQGMSAWTIGKVQRNETLEFLGMDHRSFGAESQTRCKLKLKARSEHEEDSLVTQTFTLDGGSGQILVDIECDWNVIGKPGQANPMLRVAFDTGLKDGKATYEVPFGSVERPQDGQEYPALKWADISDGTKGVAILNDSKHGFSAKDGVLRMSLIRSCFDPDPVPNPGKHHWRYAIVPHAGDWKQARIPLLAAEFNQPPVWATVSFDAKGPNPHEWSPLSFASPYVQPTALKLAEDDDSLIVRAFEWAGQKDANRIQLNFPARSASLVNFLEDRLGPLTLMNGAMNSPMRGFEIQTFRIAVERSKGQRVRG